MFLCPVTTGVAASHVQGFLGRLLDTALAGTGALLDVADVYVVPNMNPDGSFRGQYCGTYYTSTAAHIIPVLRHILYQYCGKGLGFSKWRQQHDLMCFLSGPKPRRYRRCWVQPLESRIKKFRSNFVYDLFSRTHTHKRCRVQPEPCVGRAAHRRVPRSGGRSQGTEQILGGCI